METLNFENGRAVAEGNIELRKTLRFENGRAVAEGNIEIREWGRCSRKNASNICLVRYPIILHVKYTLLYTHRQ